MKQMSSFFRAGTAAVIIDEKGLVLAFERSDIPGSWQLPQGGLHKGEEPIEGVLREILEETGIESERLEPVNEIAECELQDRAGEDERGAGRGVLS